MIPRKIYNWSCGDRSLVLGQRTLIMGILNVTPDSFSDGGNFSDPTSAVDRALEMVAQGADIIDIGGESTRPAAEPVTGPDEIKRTIPIIKKIREQSDVFLSIDTMKSEVALQAMEAGADIINDVSALEADLKMVEVAAESRAGVVLMHMRGSPKTMQNGPVYGNVVGEVRDYLQTRLNFAVEHGMARERLVIDPGIGFGKTTEHNLELLRNLPELSAMEIPLLVGASRKRFIGELTGRMEPMDRRAGSLGVALWALMRGAHILRAHDVIDTCDACKLVDTLLSGEPPCD